MKPGDRVYDPHTGQYGVILRGNEARAAQRAYLIKLDLTMERWRRHAKIAPLNKAGKPTETT